MQVSKDDAIRGVTLDLAWFVEAASHSHGQPRFNRCRSQIIGCKVHSCHTLGIKLLLARMMPFEN